MSATKVETNELSVVKSWLAKHPRRTVLLSLSTKDGEDIVELGTWPASEMRPEQAAVVVAAVDEYARSNEEDCRAHLRWSDKDGKVLQTRVLKRKCSAPPEETQPALSLDGSPMAQAAQAQAIMKDVVKMCFAEMQGAMGQMRQLASTAIDMARDVMDRTSRDRELIDGLREEIQEMVVVQAEAAAKVAEDAAAKAEEEKAPNPVEMVMATGMQMLMANNVPKPASGNGTPSA